MENFEAILTRWADAVCSHVSDNVVKLYGQNAVLVPTFSKDMRTTPEEIRDYFEGMFKKENAGVRFDFETAQAREADGRMVVSGAYTFYYDENGGRTEILSRFTFVLNPQSAAPIEHHHSSVMPE